HFLESLSLETIDLTMMGPRLVRLCHALDHLTRLHEDLTRIPPIRNGPQPPVGFEAGSLALAAWLATTKDPMGSPNPAIVKAIEDASKKLSDESKTGREALLEDVALQRMPAATARIGLETLTWGDVALYHAWRLADSLRIAAGNGSTSVVGDGHSIRGWRK